MRPLLPLLSLSVLYAGLHAVLLLSGSLDARPGTLLLDEQDYLLSAKLLTETGNFTSWGGQGAFRTPGYSFFLAAIKVLGGGYIAHVQLVQILLGWLAGLLLWRIAGRFMGNAAALAVAALFWFYPALVIYRYLIYAETLYLAVLLAAIFFLLQAGKRSSLAAGAMLGILVLIRAEYLLLALAVVVWNYRQYGRRTALLLCVAFMAVMAPWLLRNTLRYGTPLLTTMGGYNLWIGNNPQANGSGVLDDNPQAELNRVISQVNAEVPPQHDAERSEKFRAHALHYVRANPGRFIMNGFAKLGFLWAGESRILEWASYRGRIDAGGFFTTLHMMLVVLWPGLLIICAVLVFFSPASPLPHALRFLYWQPVLTSATVFVFSGEDRYHLAFLPLLCFTLGYNADRLIRQREIRLNWKRAALAVISTVLIVAASLNSKAVYDSLRDSFTADQRKK